MEKSWSLWKYGWVAFVLVGLCFMVNTSWAAPVELKIAFQPYTIHNQQVKWMQKWAETRKDVKVTPVPISYEIYYTKVSNALQSGKSEYDVVWHNDDWGAGWMNYLEYVDDVKDFKTINPFLWELCFKDKNGRSTGMPFIGTDALMFYRTDLIKSPPKTWKEVQDISISLQKEGKAKWGYVAGMKFPHAYFGFLAFMWANMGDLWVPAFERDNAKLAANGWTPMVDKPEVVEMLEFWWDQIHTYKTVPPDNISYSRTAAQAIFMAGESAMLGEDSLKYGDLNDPAKSKVVGKIGVAPFPYGPHGKGPLSWDVCWGWAIPKSISADKKKAAKELLGYLLSDDVQIDLWKTTGGIPVTGKVREKLSKSDPLFRDFAKATFQAPVLVASAYYYPKWPESHSIFTDYCVKAMMGKREDIKKIMGDCAAELKKQMSK